MQMHEQDFLDTQVRTKQKVTVYTTRGLALIGRIKSFDSDTIILEGKTNLLIYKHAIACIDDNEDVK